MWSYVQYRRIGRNVEEELKKTSARDETHTGKELDSVITVKISDVNDPMDPKNWSLGERAKNIVILSFLIFVQAWAGAAESMANAEASREFHVSPIAENLATAMYLFGVGSGALFVGPLSETIGRNPTYLASTFCYLFFVLGSALTPTFGGQVVCRYFVGLFSSATLAINGASVRDQFRPVKRAFVFPIIAWVNIVRMDSQLFSGTKILRSQLQRANLLPSSVVGFSQVRNLDGDGQSGSPLSYPASVSSFRLSSCRRHIYQSYCIGKQNIFVASPRTIDTSPNTQRGHHFINASKISCRCR